MSVEPFDNARLKGLCFRIGRGQPAIELGDTGPFVEEGEPVLDRPAFSAWPQQRHNASLVMR